MAEELHCRLLKWFDGKPTTEVSASNLKDFLKGVEKVHNLKDLCTDDIEETARGQGYSTHAILWKSMDSSVVAKHDGSSSTSSTCATMTIQRSYSSVR